MTRLLLLLTFFVLLIPAHSESSIDVGIVGFNPPYEMVVDAHDNLVGFEADLIQEICERIDLECHFITMQFSSLFEQLEKGQIELAVGVISITPERKKNYLFSLPYIESKLQFITQTHSSFQKVSELKGRRIGVLSGTLIEPFALDLFNQDAQIKEYPTNPSMLQALRDKKIDAILIDKKTAIYWENNNSKNIRLIGKTYKLGIGYAFMTTKDHKELIKKINQALLDMEQDGSYLKIYNKYFTPE